MADGAGGRSGVQLWHPARRARQPVNNPQTCLFAAAAGRRRNLYRAPRPHIAALSGTRHGAGPTPEGRLVSDVDAVKGGYCWPKERLK